MHRLVEQIPLYHKTNGGERTCTICIEHKQELTNLIEALYSSHSDLSSCFIYVAK